MGGAKFEALDDVLDDWRRGHDIVAVLTRVIAFITSLTDPVVVELLELKIPHKTVAVVRSPMPGVKQEGLLGLGLLAVDV